ncbi:GNAT family N-acetyltransferase [Cohaesibacter sp. ES.047]|uniref:GNAT family N-acetyltransferase n=1 Tax=Cohaesibacter sp. ES.047 TaxID=1798205 RepID=UPI0012FD52B4|nr:GNAT family N-acetyltransferase [Cohaesibacter sp. ES.047]
MESSKPLRFRVAQKTDAALIHHMVSELSAFLGDTEKHVARAEDYAEHGFGDVPAFEAVIAELDGEAVGMCLYFNSFSTWQGKPGFYVQDLYVSNKARGLGLGRKLIEQVAAIGRDRGCCYLRLSVDAANLSAQGFYEACGFQWSESEKIFAVKGDAFRVLSGGSSGGQEA